MSKRIQLDVSCPECGRSLMDPDHPIEGVPSVLCEIEIPGPNPRLPRKTPIRFSSYYGSGQFECDEPLGTNTHMVLSCPLCHASLHGDMVCPSCGDPMVTLDIQGGGRLTACTRRDCKKHFLEVGKSVTGLENIFETGGLENDGTESSPLQSREIKAEYSTPDHKEIIASGSFLSAYCPHCHKSLIEGDNMVFRIRTQEGREGLFSLSAYLNVFTNESTVEIPFAEELADLSCTHCNRSLLVDEPACDTCGARTAMVTVSAMRKLISFFICMKIGCNWHGISEEDTQLLALEDSAEW